MLKKPERILDVGAGSGEFLYSISSLGKDVQGIEPNRDYAEYCRDSLSLNVQTLQIADFDPGETKFDFIRLSHVLEHLNDPVSYLSTLADWLSDDGILYLEVPNILDYASGKSKGNMFHFGHIYNFSPWTLVSVAGLAGLREYEKTSSRQADSTGMFFEKSTAPIAVSQQTGKENAKRVFNAIDRHYSHGRVGTGVKAARKFLRKSGKLIDETVSVSGFKTPKEIGNSVLVSSEVRVN